MEPPVGARAALCSQLSNMLVIVDISTTHRLYSHARSWYNRGLVNDTLIHFRGCDVFSHPGLAEGLTSNTRRSWRTVRVSCGCRWDCRLGERHCTRTFRHGVLERWTGTAGTRPWAGTVDKRDEGRRALYRRLSRRRTRYQDLHQLLVEGRTRHMSGWSVNGRLVRTTSLCIRPSLVQKTSHG